MFAGVSIDLPSDSIIGDLTKSAEMNVIRAVNRTGDWTRTQAARRIVGQVAFPRGYLDPGQGNLVVATKATLAKPAVIIRARQRPTQLSRFMIASGAKGRGATVMVRPGEPVERAKFFVLNLKNGNVGIAVRLKPGALTPEGAKRRKISPWEQANSLMILYTASVDQVFSHVRNEMVPDITSFYTAELARLMSVETFK